jgi:hypothetical protein
MIAVHDLQQTYAPQGKRLPDAIKVVDGIAFEVAASSLA